MAPLKFEEDIKEKLDQRTLAPSQDAWSRLSKKLDQQRRPKTWWIYLAAASVVMLLSVAFFFQKEQVPTPVVVEVDTSPLNKEEVVQPKANEKEVVIQVPQERIAKKQQVVPNSKVAISSETKEKKIEEVLETMVATEDFPASNALDPSETALALNSIEEAKIAEIVAQAQQLQAQNNVVTDAEIDSLLASAQTAIARERALDRTQMTTAEALLLEVEEELDQSFRDKVFEALKEGFVKVKTAVAERNQ